MPQSLDPQPVISQPQPPTTFHESTRCSPPSQDYQISAQDDSCCPKLHLLRSFKPLPLPPPPPPRPSHLPLPLELGLARLSTHTPQSAGVCVCACAPPKPAQNRARPFARNTSQILVLLFFVRTCVWVCPRPPGSHALRAAPRSLGDMMSHKGALSVAARLPLDTERERARHFAPAALFSLRGDQRREA